MPTHENSVPRVSGNPLHNLGRNLRGWKWRVRGLLCVSQDEENTELVCRFYIQHLKLTSGCTCRGLLWSVVLEPPHKCPNKHKVISRRLTASPICSSEGQCDGLWPKNDTFHLTLVMIQRPLSNCIFWQEHSQRPAQRSISPGIGFADTPLSVNPRPVWLNSVLIYQQEFRKDTQRSIDVSLFYQSLQPSAATQWNHCSVCLTQIKAIQIFLLFAKR